MCGCLMIKRLHCDEQALHEFWQYQTACSLCLWREFFVLRVEMLRVSEALNGRI